MNLLNYTFFKYILFYTFLLYFFLLVCANKRQAYHNFYAMNAFSTVKIFRKPRFFMGSELFINNSLTHSRFTKVTYEDIRVAYSIQFRSFEIRHPSQEWPPLQCVSFSYTRKAQIRVFVIDSGLYNYTNLVSYFFFFYIYLF